MLLCSYCTLLLLSVLSFNLFAHGNQPHTPAIVKGTDAAAAKVVPSFHQALNSGDKQQASAVS